MSERRGASRIGKNKLTIDSPVDRKLSLHGHERDECRRGARRQIGYDKGSVVHTRVPPGSTAYSTKGDERRMDGHHVKRHESRFDCNLPLCEITEGCEQVCNARR